MKSAIRKNWFRETFIKKKKLDAQVEKNELYYQSRHDTDRKFQNNNWLMDDADLLCIQARSVLELGCGNGRFLLQAMGTYDQVYGCDWALSPILAKTLLTHPKIRFLKLNVMEDPLPGPFDLVCSGDFLEHLAPASLDQVLTKIDHCARQAYHKIACYDDGHSHLSIFSPEEWLRRFRNNDPGYQMAVDESRGENKKVAIIKKTHG